MAARTKRVGWPPFLMAVVSAIATLLMGCGPGPAATRPAASAREVESIPVVRPFALERAGEQAAFDVVLPEDGDRRDVVVGVRAVHDPRDPARRESGTRVLRYLGDADIPVEVRVARWSNGAWSPVTLSKMRIDHVNRHYEYRPHPEPVFRRHRAAHWDGGELIDAGLWNLQYAYFEHEFAVFGETTPGRYRVTVRTLEAHPALEGTPYELVVGRRRRY